MMFCFESFVNLLIKTLMEHVKVIHISITQIYRERRDEADVQSLVEFMDICWLNPLSQDHSDVVSLSTATVAPPDRAADLFGAHRIGEEAYQAFKQERLEANAATTKFHVKMT